MGIVSCFVCCFCVVFVFLQFLTLAPYFYSRYDLVVARLNIRTVDGCCEYTLLYVLYMGF